MAAELLDADYASWELDNPGCKCVFHYCARPNAAWDTMVRLPPPLFQLHLLFPADRS
jgi:hypothetical protein